MGELIFQKSKLLDSDLDFVIRQAAPEFKDKGKLRCLIREDEYFRRGLIGDENVFKQVIADGDIIVRISPALYFEILLRKAHRELQKVSLTMERTGSQVIPVFDAEHVDSLLGRDEVLYYLADMLSSFTRIESFTIPVRVREGIWRKIRFNDMDIDSLTKFCSAVNEEDKFRFYRRIGDICLFVLGMFPEYAQLDCRRCSPVETSQRLLARLPRTMDDYEEEGKRFYKLAAEHDMAGTVELSGVFWLLHGNFHEAMKPLNFICDHYLHYNKHKLFGGMTGQGG